jgi:hypothetical protein
MTNVRCFDSHLYDMTNALTTDVIEAQKNIIEQTLLKNYKSIKLQEKVLVIMRGILKERKDA